MPRILTVDDSNAIRSIVTKQLTELGFDVDQAEDGEQGLAKLEEIHADLVLLDVTMPVMDGPTMLARLRARGDKTPVIMLTSESKRSIVSDAVKLGIDDYILKPFKPDELRAKVLKALHVDAPAPAAPAPSVAVAPTAPPTAAAPAAGASRPFVDVLVVDDMENVHKKLRSLLPAHVTVSSCVSAREALQHAQERVFRVIVIDLVIPDVNSIALMNQLRALQPHAVMVALALRTTNDIASEVRAQGFHDAMFKPFEAAAIDDFLSKYFDVKDELTVEGNVLLCATYKGKPEKLDRYFTRLGTLCREHLEKLASACHEDVILDLTHAPVRNDRLIRLVMDVDKAARSLGMVVTLVGTGELKKIFAAVVETASVPFCASVSEARGAAA